MSAESDADTYHRCLCGMTVTSMDHFADHVADDHDVFDVAVQALHEGEVVVDESGVSECEE